MSEGRVPKSHKWCSYCIAPEQYGDQSRGKGTPCQDHRPKGAGPWNGQYVEYTGRDAYEPSPWVLEVVGGIYKGHDGKTYECFGYDPRHGFWMRTTREERETRQMNVSERAIGGTFHRVRTDGPTRAEYIRWCKQRAIDALNYSGKPSDAMASLMSDFSKHEETKNLIDVAGLGAMTVRTREEAIKFVEDFAE